MSPITDHYPPLHIFCHTSQRHSLAIFLFLSIPDNFDSCLCFTAGWRVARSKSMSMARRRSSFQSLMENRCLMENCSLMMSSGDNPPRSCHSMAPPRFFPPILPSVLVRTRDGSSSPSSSSSLSFRAIAASLHVNLVGRLSKQVISGNFSLM